MPTLSDAIGSDGPLLRVEVGVSRSHRRRLRAANRPVPQALSLTALIDTGAEITCLDPRAVARLQLQSGSYVPVNAPSLGGLSFPNAYDVSLTVLHPSGNPADNLTVHDLPVAELPLGAFRIDLLIGRDVLALCRFDYDGPAGTFTLAY
jgi:hypothetical protein